MTERVTPARIALVIAGKDLRQRLRDRTAYFAGIIAPLALAAIVSGALGGTTSGNFHATIAVADLDTGPVGQGLATALQTPALRRIVTVRAVADATRAHAAVASDAVEAALVVPSGVSSVVLTGGAATVDVIRSPRHEIPGALADALARGFGARINAAGLVARTALATGAATPATIVRLVASIATAAPPIGLGTTSLATKPAPPASFFGPSMAMVFLFFTAGASARSLLTERQAGTLARILAAPVSGTAVIAGKALAGFVVALGSFATLVVASRLLLGASWGSPVAVALLVVATVVALTGVASLVATLSRTDEQARSIVAFVGFAFALLGGSFIPAGQAPSSLRTLMLATPNGWSLRAFADLAFGGEGVRAIAPNLIVLTSIGLLAGMIATRTARRMVAA